MKWYGIEVKKFCGALISSGGTPILTPEFNIRKIRVPREFKVRFTDKNVERFNTAFIKGTKTFGVSFKTGDEVKFNVQFNKPPREYKVLQL